jgi:hypothetical protein
MPVANTLTEKSMQILKNLKLTKKDWDKNIKILEQNNTEPTVTESKELDKAIEQTIKTLIEKAKSLVLEIGDTATPMMLQTLQGVVKKPQDMMTKIKNLEIAVTTYESINQRVEKAKMPPIPPRSSSLPGHRTQSSDPTSSSLKDANPNYAAIDEFPELKGLQQKTSSPGGNEPLYSIPSKPRTQKPIPAPRPSLATRGNPSLFGKRQENAVLASENKPTPPSKPPKPK